MPAKFPIIILLETHIDTGVASCIEPLVNRLITKGYDTLCLELPCDLPLEQIQRGLSGQISRVERSVIPMVLEFINLGIQATGKEPKRIYNEQTLLALKWAELSALLKQYLPPQLMDHEKITLDLCSHVQYKISRVYLENLRRKIKMVSIDSPTTKLTGVTEDQFEMREKHMAVELLKLYTAGKNIVFKVGKAHADGLFAILKAIKLADKTIFLELLSPDTVPQAYAKPSTPKFLDDATKVNKLRFVSPDNIDAQWQQIESLIAGQMGEDKQAVAAFVTKASSEEDLYDTPNSKSPKNRFRA